jgi:hypothetical protein
MRPSGTVNRGEQLEERLTSGYYDIDVVDSMGESAMGMRA